MIDVLSNTFWVRFWIGGMIGISIIVFLVYLDLKKGKLKYNKER